MFRALLIIIFVCISSINRGLCQEVIINEVLPNPSGQDTSWESGINANSLYNGYSNMQPPDNKEWVELFNPSSTNSVDIGCYTLGSNMYDYDNQYDNWGAFTFPEGTTIPPLGYIIVGGNNSDVPVLDFDLTYYYTYFFQNQYIDGFDYRWFLRNQWGWIAIYDPSGNPVDAVYWTDSLGVEDDISSQSQYQYGFTSMTTCYGFLDFASAADIPDIEFIGKIFKEDLSFQRDIDGFGGWGNGETVPTPRNCNGGCADFLYNNPCQGFPTHFTYNPLSPIQLDSSRWDFGDPGSGSENLSTLTNPDHLYSQFGSYDVMMIIYFSNLSDTILKTITVFLTPEANLGEDHEICKDSTITLVAGNGTQYYIWSTGETASSISVSTSGQYMVTVFEAGCSDSDTVEVVVHSTTIDLGQDTILCDGNFISFNAGANFAAYKWNDGSTDQFFTTQNEGIFSVTITDTNNCFANDSITVNRLSAPQVDLIPDTLVCDLDNLIVDAYSENASYLWSTMETSPQIQITYSGTYTVIVTNQCGNDTATSTITFDNTPEVELVDSTLCEDDSISLKVNSTYDNILWSTSDTVQTIYVKIPGLYSVSVQNECGTVRDSSVIEMIIFPQVDLGNDTTIEQGQIIELDAGQSEGIFEWSIGDSIPQISVGSRGTYWVIVTNYCGTASDTIVISIDECIPDVVVPNIFTPNGDGLHDVVYINNKCGALMSFTVLSRWGNYVFQKDARVIVWDGHNFSGEPLVNGIYFYLLDYTDNNGNLIQHKGFIHLIR